MNVHPAVTVPVINYYLEPRWVTAPGADNGGWAYFAAVEVETGRFLAEGDDRTVAAQRAERTFPGAIRMSNTEAGWVAADKAVHA